MEGIIKAEDLPEKENVYLRKGQMFGWRVVHPIKNEDGSINWFNLFTGGSWWNWIIISIVVLMMLGIFYEYNLNIQYFMDCFKSPQQLENCMNVYGYGS